MIDTKKYPALASVLADSMKDQLQSHWTVTVSGYTGSRDITFSAYFNPNISTDQWEPKVVSLVKQAMGQILLAAGVPQAKLGIEVSKLFAAHQMQVAPMKA
jgi:hypothetical protein